MKNKNSHINYIFIFIFNFFSSNELLNALITTPIEILVVISISDDADEQKVFDTLQL